MIGNRNKFGLIACYAQNVASFNSHQSAYILCYLVVNQNRTFSYSAKESGSSDKYLISTKIS